MSTASARNRSLSLSKGHDLSEDVPFDKLRERESGGRRGKPGRGAAILRGVVLALGALVFLFPFYYMVIGSLQRTPDATVAGAFPNPANLTIENYEAINSRIGLLTGLVNSGIFTGGVILGTVVFGMLAGYALSVLQWRGRGVTFALALLVQVVPFQLLMIPLYVLIARDYGLADTHLGMILPFLINSTSVIIFRQYFLQVPKELFDAARIDGASELRVLWNVAIPLVRPSSVRGTSSSGRSSSRRTRRCSRSPCPSRTTSRPSRRPRPTPSVPSWPERSCSLHPPSRCSSCSSATSPPPTSAPA
jgi:ABC-type glycerol-3-phosphate transport system permease component